MSVKVAACQVPHIKRDIAAALQSIEKFTAESSEKGASIICFPECFLQGYLTDMESAKHHALGLASDSFGAIMARLSVYKPIIVFGMIETDNNVLYNSAVVIKQGKLLGKYRKTHLLKGERIFAKGSEYPFFELGDLKFGINICYDTQFPESTANVAKQGASLILCPSNNMMRIGTAEATKALHHEVRIRRVIENNVWLISSDVTGVEPGRISYGPTSAINPKGQIVAEVATMTTGMIIVEVT